MRFIVKVASVVVMLGFAQLAQADPITVIAAQTQVDFVGPFNQAPPDPITFVFSGLPTNPIGPGSLTVSGAIGDFTPGSTESFGISAEGLIDFGILYNNNPADDLFDNASFGDSGSGSLAAPGAASATAIIDLATLSALVNDGTVAFLVVFGATVGDRPQESLTLTLQYSALQHHSVPEPSALVLLSTGIAALGCSGRWSKGTTRRSR